ncbi:MAG: LacI family DNA-binding transcriptional regulator [Clostridiales Family XIII bacterium]|jgi:LacI family transcriptional regulator|nr:LacI family DNA-binding transcriptional regulator [Clostridiales Family XIII bacterium]
MITIKQIAELAGTSRGTVDRVLNRRGNVSPDIEKLVLKIAKEHNYRSNPFAKALAKRGAKYTIGIIINSIGNMFFDDVIVGINETVEKYKEYGLEVLIREIKGYDENEQLEALVELSAHNLSALVITPIDHPLIEKKLAALSPLPIVALNSDIHFDRKLAFIGCDYYNSGGLSGDIAELMLPNGGDISIITGSFHMLGHNERIRGFKDALKNKGNIRIVSTDANDDDNEISYSATAAVLERYNPDLLYFCAAGTEGGVRAVKDSSSSARVIVVDDIKPMRDYLADGSINAIITQQPYCQGELTIETLYQYFVYGYSPDQVNCYTENQVRLRHSK